MALYVNQGLDLLTQHNLGLLNNISLALHLYTNNWIPTLTDTSTSYVECNLGGYAAIALTPSLWQGNTVNGLSSYTYPTQTFTFNANVNNPQTTIFGWYLQDLISFKIICAEAIVPSYNVPAAGGTIQITLAWGEGNC